MKTIEGHWEAHDCRFGIVVSKFNEFVTSRLMAEALSTLEQAGAREGDIELVRVPGAFEIPLVARQLARSGRFDAIICLGAVIRGETPHFEYISAETSRGIGLAAWDTNIPVVFGILTTNSVDQALDRAGGGDRNKGAEAAKTAIEMATLMKQLHAMDRKPTGFQNL